MQFKLTTQRCGLIERWKRRMKALNLREHGEQLRGSPAGQRAPLLQRYQQQLCRKLMLPGQRTLLQLHSIVEEALLLHAKARLRRRSSSSYCKLALASPLPHHPMHMQRLQ